MSCCEDVEPADPSANSHAASTFLQLRFLCLRNLAFLLHDDSHQVRAVLEGSALLYFPYAWPAVKLASARKSRPVGLHTSTSASPQYTSPQALELYCLAASLGLEDVALWHEMADTAMACGQHGLARLALERGLSLSPRHVLMLEKLMQV